jgi:DNA-binding transcriptional LysR family regulator
MPIPPTMQGPGGREPFKPSPPVLMSNNETLLHQAALQGMGFAFLPSWLVADDLATGRLETVLAHYPPQQLPLFAVYASRRHLSPRLRSFLDHLIQEGRFGQ